MDRFNSYSEGRDVRTCCKGEVEGGAWVLGTSVQWIVAFTEMGKIGEHIREQVDSRA